MSVLVMIRLYLRPNHVSSMARNATNLLPFCDIELDIKSNKKELNNNANSIHTHMQLMMDRPLNERIRSPMALTSKVVAA